MVRALILALFLSSGCVRCREGTVLVEMKLPKNTNLVDISVQLGSEMARGYQRTPHGSHEFLEVTFSGGYLQGSYFTVYAEAFQNGNSLGARSQDLTLEESCTIASLDWQ
jgi:hypothetical protein